MGKMSMRPGKKGIFYSVFVQDKRLWMSGKRFHPAAPPHVIRYPSSSSGLSTVIRRSSRRMMVAARREEIPDQVGDDGRIAGE